MTTRRLFVAVAMAATLAGCASAPTGPSAEPIVFVHGDGNSAIVWQTTVWRFESNGWPRDRLYALDAPYPSARNDDAKAQPGRTSTAQHMAYLKAEVEKVMKKTGASKVILVGNSRGGYAIRNYIQNGGGDQTVSHAILGGTPNHGVQAVKGLNEGNEYSGTGPFLTGLNKPKDAAGDEVTGRVRWLVIRSDSNDKFAQPDGFWIGMAGKPTNITYAAPELKGATNVVLAQVDHRETSFSPQSFEATYRFITGHAPRTLAIEPEQHPVLDGTITGSGVDPLDPKSGDFADNLPLPGARLQIYAVDPATGTRIGDPVHERTVGVDGRWGPFNAAAGTPYEFVVSAPGYATTHVYRGPWPRSSNIVHLHPERVAAADREAAAVVTFVRMRGYFDVQRDPGRFDGHSPLPGIPPRGAGTGGAGLSVSKMKYPAVPDRPILAEYGGERVVGRAWPAAANEVTVLELTH